MADNQSQLIRADNQQVVPIKAVDLGDGTYAYAVAGAASEAFQGTSGVLIVNPSATFTRPSDTTAYAVGDLVANDVDAGDVAPMQFTTPRVAGGTCFIHAARGHKTGTSISGATFRLHLYSSAPTPANGDNGVWSTNQSANYIGAIEITFDRAFTDGATGSGLLTRNADMFFDFPSGSILYALVEARGVYTPISGEVFTFKLEVIQN